MCVGGGMGAKRGIFEAGRLACEDSMMRSRLVIRTLVALNALFLGVRFFVISLREILFNCVDA